MNGYTIESMISTIKARNNGNQCVGNVNLGCLYNDGNGNHCAVGCFLPDDHPAMSNKNVSVTGIVEGGIDPDLEKILPISLVGMQRLQSKHDDSIGCKHIHDVLEKWIRFHCED